MGYLGRRIGLSQDNGDSNPSGANGAVGGGILDLFANGYFERQGGIYNNPGLGPLSGLTATGGIINDYTDGSAVYRTHIFTSTGVFDITDDTTDFGTTVDYLIVGGGGGGGGDYEAGGGGAGGFRTTLPESPGGQAVGNGESAYTVAAGSYTITVGGGGAGGTAGGGAGSRGTSGTQSWFTPTPQSYPHPSYIRSEGGGGGGTYSPGTPHSEAIGIPGGSGGGAGNCHPAGPAAGGTADRISGTSTAVATQGYRGGNRGPQPHAPYHNGAGGGGAGAAGADQNDNTLPGSFGGNGKRTTITGPGYTIGTPGPSSTGGTGGGDDTAVTGGWLAGGGGGGLYSYTPTANLPQTRGAGGGGAGGNGGTVVDATSAVAATGSGGGGSGHTGRTGGSGGSGIVVVRYQIGSITADARATGGSISFYNSGSGMKTIHTFTNSGTFATKDTWSATNVEYVVVGGGGGGGDAIGGGGGAGGYITGTTPIGAHPVSTTIQVGAGGGVTNSARGLSGSPSHFGTPLTAYGGGGGGSDNGGQQSSQNGGSGGGASIQSTAPYIGAGDKQTDTVNAASITPQGYPGGGGSTDGAYIGLAGGVGGAGGAGQSAPTSNWSPGTKSGHGGIGKRLPPTFRNPASSPGPNGGGLGALGPGSTDFWFAGGGGGGGDNRSAPSPVSPPHAGGDGGGSGGPYAGGGNGEDASEGGESGRTSTGGGGGGGAHNSGSPAGTFGGRGGSGIVFIAYPT